MSAGGAEAGRREGGDQERRQDGNGTASLQCGRGVENPALNRGSLSEADEDRVHHSPGGTSPVQPRVSNPGSSQSPHRTASAPPRLRAVPLAESALLIQLDSGTVDRALVEEVSALAIAVEQAAIPGVIDIVPAYTTILVSFDPREIEPATLMTRIEQAAMTRRGAQSTPREVTIPVVYGGEYGPDLDDVAAITGLSAKEVIARHTGTDYLVACIGFSPGFPYLLGLPADLATPRLPNPRTRVPAGSVGIGGEQTGVYPQATPGGWRLIGRTPLRLFDPEGEEPFLLRAGDHLRFTAISDAEFTDLATVQSSRDRRD